MKIKPLQLARYIFLIIIVAIAISRLAPHLGDFHKIVELKDRIHYGWLLAAIATQILQYVGDGWLSKVLLNIVGATAKMKDSMRIASLNVFAAHLLPIGEAGGLAAAYHFYRKLGVTPEKFIFLTLCWTIVTNILLFLMLIVPLFLMPNKPAYLNKTLTYGAIATILIILTLYTGRKVIYTKLEKLLGKYKWFSYLSNFIKERKIYQNLLLKHPGQVIQSLLAGFLYYASNVGTLVFSFLAFDVMPSLEIAVFAYTASLLLGRVTLAPAGIGAAEATLILIFLESTNINSNIILAGTFLYRVISFWLPIPAGFISYYSLRKDTNKKQINSELKEELKEDLIENI